MGLINSIGDSIDERSARAHIYNLSYQNLIDDKSAKIMLSVLADVNFREIDRDTAGKIRATLLKKMLISYVN